MDSFKNFNRQENFNALELAFLWNTVRTFDQLVGMSEFKNKLNGLFDGYLYNDLMELCQSYILEFHDELNANELLVATHRAKADLKLIIEKIEGLPTITPEQANSIV